MSVKRLGLIKTSLIDYPGEVAAVLFTAGCNLRCPFCHNPGLVSGETPPDFVTREEIAAFLGRRSSLLGGVCITGGEPLIHEDLPDLVDLVRGLNLKLKIDTNGTFPERLAEISPDFIALDIKTAPAKYNRLLPGGTQLQLDLFEELSPAIPRVWEKVHESLERIASGDPSGNLEYEIRTTVVPGLVTTDDIETITELLAELKLCTDRGRYVLAGYKCENVLNPAYASVRPYPLETLEVMAETAKKRGLSCSVRPNL